jgi:hypothetical protein
MKEPILLEKNYIIMKLFLKSHLIFENLLKLYQYMIKDLPEKNQQILKEYLYFMKYITENNEEMKVIFKTNLNRVNN